MGTKITIDSRYELYVLLLQAARAMNRVRDATLREIGITTTQAAVLFIIKSVDDVATPAEISRWLFREPHTVSDILRRMEKQGLIKMTKDLHRKNLIRVSITEKGESAFQESRDFNEINSVLSSLSDEDIEKVKSSLNLIRNRALKKTGLKYQPPFP